MNLPTKFEKISLRITKDFAKKFCIYVQTSKFVEEEKF